MTNTNLYACSPFFQLVYTQASEENLFPIDKQIDKPPFDSTTVPVDTPTCMVYFYLGTRTQVEVDKKTYTLYYGDVLVISKDSHAQFSSDLTIKNTAFKLRIPTSLIQQFAQTSDKQATAFQNFFNQTETYHLSFVDQETLRDLFQAILDLRHQPIAQIHFIANYYLLQMCQFLFSAEKLIEIQPQFSKNRYFSHMLYYIDHQFTNSRLNLEYLSDIFSLSPFYFSKLFRKEMGCNFHDYLIHKRATYAAHLMDQLAPDAIRLQEISTQSGFGDYSTFYRGFKKTFQQSPKHYLKNRNKTNPPS